MALCSRGKLFRQLELLGTGGESSSFMKFAISKVFDICVSFKRSAVLSSEFSQWLSMFSRDAPCTQFRTFKHCSLLLGKLQVEHFLGDPDVLHAIALILGSELSFFSIQVLACAIGTSRREKVLNV